MRNRLRIANPSRGVKSTRDSDTWCDTTLERDGDMDELPSLCVEDAVCWRANEDSHLATPFSATTRDQNLDHHTTSFLAPL